MNDADLDKLLKSARPPERLPEDWVSLSKKIIARLHWQERTDAASVPRRNFFLLWGLGLASACLVGLLAFSHWQKRDHHEPAAVDRFAAAEKCYRKIQEMFPHQLRAIVFSDRDSQIDLAETANQPNAQPIFLKICGPGGCETVITFSGQRIRVGDEECDVLAGGAGGIIVAGDNSVWTSDEPSHRLNKCRIEAKPLKST